MELVLGETLSELQLVSKTVKIDENLSSMEKPSFTEVVSEHYDYLYKYAFRYFHSREKAEEVVQEACLSGYQAYERFEGRASVRTWLTSILRNKITDSVRAAGRLSELSAESSVPLDNLFDSQEHWIESVGPRFWGPNPEEALEQQEFLIVLEQCLKKLPEQLRQVFLLRELDGFERVEIADKLGVSSNNVGVTLHRARTALQQCLHLNWFEVVKEAQ